VSTHPTHLVCLRHCFWAIVAPTSKTAIAQQWLPTMAQQNYGWPYNGPWSYCYLGNIQRSLQLLGDLVPRPLTGALPLDPAWARGTPVRPTNCLVSQCQAQIAATDENGTIRMLEQGKKWRGRGVVGVGPLLENR